jgi:transglutaminase-like putative cysteine protease
LILEITHSTRLKSPAPATRSSNLVRLAPADGGGQRRVAYALRLRPNARVRDYRDVWDNLVQYFTVTDTHFELSLRAYSRVETSPLPAPPGPVPWSAFGSADAAAWLDLTLQTPLTDLGPIPPGGTAGEDAWAWVGGVVGDMRGRLRYQKGVTGVETTAAQALVRGEGVCQDFAHAALGLLRANRIPARYVGGYQFLGDGAEHEPHAWIEVWHPAGTWVGFDPTSGDPVDERYVRVAVGRDYSDAAPVRGHVIFAAPPDAEIRSDPPSVEVSIVRIASPNVPLGFTVDGETAAEEDGAGRPTANAPSRPRSPR